MVAREISRGQDGRAKVTQRAVERVAPGLITPWVRDTKGLVGIVGRWATNRMNVGRAQENAWQKWKARRFRPRP